VWTQLKQAGRAGYARMISEDIELAERFYRIAEGRAELQPFGHGLSITTYRFVPEDLRDRADELEVLDYLNELNREIQSRITLEDVERLAEITETLGRQADSELRPEELG
jgi:glutamate/tyrosine decarboxylase-like PLP-dependent enzyme